jgi:F0F1-type ATP synthase assembly protein I
MGSPDKKDQKQYTTNLLLVVVAGQAGCLTLIIIFGALFGGLWLDNYLDTRPLFTILLMVGSVPLTLAAMLWLVRTTTSRIKPATTETSEENEQNEIIQEDANRAR